MNGTNKLVILFTSAFLLGKAIEEQHLGKEKHLTLWNGDPSRLFVRKVSLLVQDFPPSRHPLTYAFS